MKNLKYKKGVAIETAILVMFALIGFSILLTSITLIASNNKFNRLSSLTEQITLDTAGEDFITAVQSGEDLSQFLVEGYQASATVSNESGANFYSLTLTKQDKVVFTVTLKQVDSNYKIIKWKYS